MMDKGFCGFEDSKSPSETLQREVLALFDKALYAPVPALLRPAFAPSFKNCVICEADLLAHGVHYLVFKECRREEVIVEMAICLDCLDVLSQVYSGSTQLAVDTLFVQSNWVRQANDRLEANASTFHKWLDYCALTGQARAECDAYEVLGICMRGRVQVSFFPYVICTRGIQLMESVMSSETQANWGRFLGQHQGLTPELGRLLFQNRAPFQE